jgi:hypothetical protein
MLTDDASHVPATCQAPEHLFSLAPTSAHEFATSKRSAAHATATACERPHRPTPTTTTTTRPSSSPTPNHHTTVKMPGVSVRDVPADKFINAYAAFLKRQGKLPIPGP